MIFRPRSSPLHAARAAVASGWCVALALLALTLEHPLLLVVVLATVLAAAGAARVLTPVVRATAWALPFALVIAGINAIVSRDGLTVILWGPELPGLGRLDITAEALAYGAVLGLRAVVVIACFALHSAAVDPDALLRGVRRLGVRSALTVAVSMRLVGLLARDARRFHDAQRSRGGGAPPRTAVVRAVAVNALDRAGDVAATLEIRGYADSRRAPAGSRRPWSRHDLAFALAGTALGVLAVAVAWLGLDPYEPYPLTHAPVDAGVTALAGVALALGLLPFADRRGIGA